jgi:glycosyltransferase involved in cell wall biosynthesis
MRVVALSTVFPNPEQPTLGVFVKERMRWLVRHCDVVVVSPIPWFPLDGLVRKVHRSLIPKVESQEGLRVYHPRFFCIPRYLKWLDGLFYACSILPFLWRLRKEFPFDLIDSHFTFPDGMAAGLLGKIFRCPVVITLRGSLPRLTTYCLHRPQLRWALSTAARVLSVSQSLKQAAIGLGIPEHRISVIPNGVDTAKFFPRDRNEARRALGLPLHRTILLSVGIISERKGHHRVIGCLPRVLAHHSDLLYLIVGMERPGLSSRPMLERMTLELGLQECVRIVGERPHDEVPLWMAAADVVCLATRREGRPNVLLEALACGKPVVATRIDGIPELVTSDALGILVSPGDDEGLAKAILEALNRTWNVDRLVRHARAYSWEIATRSVIEEFRRIATTANPDNGSVPDQVSIEARGEHRVPPVG